MSTQQLSVRHEVCVNETRYYTRIGYGNIHPRAKSLVGRVGLEEGRSPIRLKGE
jgi:hypothetical protein